MLCGSIRWASAGRSSPADPRRDDLGVYLNALDNPFVYDDFFTVTGNPSIASAADPRWTLVYMPFRPVINFSYAADHRLWGYRPFGYHVTSVLLHAAVSAVAVRVPPAPAWRRTSRRRS